MSGIDEIRMESCQACLENNKRRGLDIDAGLTRQYWTIRSRHGDILGYYNPDVFRASKGDRLDKVNPTSGTRRRIAENPDWFLDSIHHFVCEMCSDRIEKRHPEFDTMKYLVYEFITGDVFPQLSR